jgi:hypothetical protein
MSGWIGNGPQQMNFLGPNNQKNYKAYINLVNGNEFEIILEFFLIQDLLDWVDLYDTDNQRKLLYSSADPSTPILTNLVNSVYLNTKAFGSLLYIVDPNVITQYTGTPPKPVYYECYLDTKVMFDVRWWGQGIGGSFSEMTNPLFSFSRSSNPVTQLSTLHTTTVSFDVYYSGVIDNVIFWLFDTSNNDNSVDFYDNYDSSRALIPTIVTPGIIDNKLESPSVAVTSLGGGHYYVSATISKNLNPNGRYRLGAICYSSADDIVNSFLSDELTVKTTVDVWDVCCDMNVDVHWLDYVHDHNDACFMPTLKERIKNDMYITAGSFDGCLTALGMPPGKNYLDYLSAINLTIYQKRDTYPTPTDRTYFIYAKYQSIRDTSVSGNWINPDSRLFCSDDGTTLYTSWAGRVLWNDTLFNPNNVAVSTMNEWGIKYPTGAILGQQYVNFHNITYNWANQDIYFEYSFYFDLNPFLLNQTVVLTQINQLHPMDYANNILPPYDQIIDYMSLTGFKDGVATSFVGSTFCADKYDYVEVNVRLFAPYVDGKLIATLNYAPYTEFSIKEHESFTSTNMAQLTDIEMFNVDVDFFGGSANFAINTSMLPAGQYQICAIRIPD